MRVRGGEALVGAGRCGDGGQEGSGDCALLTAVVGNDAELIARRGRGSAVEKG